MPREKFQTLTEQMFYILLCLRTPCCGTDIMEQVRTLTHGRVTVGPGTLYHLLDSFVGAGMIEEVDAESKGRRRSYKLTPAGETALRQEYNRINTLAADYQRCFCEEVHP